MPLPRAQWAYRPGITLLEILVALGVFLALLSAIIWIFGFGSRATGTLSTHLGLHQASRKAVVRLLSEIREGMEVVTPAPGSTLAYALIRDKVSLVRWFHLVPQADQPGLFELWRHVADSSLPPGQRNERFLSSVKRITFTCRSEGALQVNLLVTEEGHEYPVLTTVRLRNLASAEEVW